MLWHWMNWCCFVLLRVMLIYKSASSLIHSLFTLLHFCSTTFQFISSLLRWLWAEIGLAEHSCYQNIVFVVATKALTRRATETPRPKVCWNVVMLPKEAITAITSIDTMWTPNCVECVGVCHIWECMAGSGLTLRCTIEEGPILCGQTTPKLKCLQMETEAHRELPGLWVWGTIKPDDWLLRQESREQLGLHTARLTHMHTSCTKVLYTTLLGLTMLQGNSHALCICLLSHAIGNVHDHVSQDKFRYAV